MTSSRRAIGLLLVPLMLSLALADGRQGHSKHGTAFDAGLRTRPWVMKGIGNAPFPITTKSAEVQRWYNQGNALVHNFWFEEAERAFRWCHKLEPDNAMVYLGLARCGLNWFTVGGLGPNGKRYQDFLREAVKRKAGLTRREKMYIEAWEATFLEKNDKPVEVMVRKLTELCAAYPDDLEAKAILGMFNIGQGSPLANDFLLREVLRVAPMHPGAHHALIHNWDGQNPEQALRSCELYGKAAPATGHSLHMPGHIYSKVGMWHEAAIAMDSATRVELQYMNDRLALPYETWNYTHNRDYLCYIQEQLGRAEDSIRGAKDLMAAPQDPEVNPADTAWTQMPLLRALVKFERWSEILDGKTIRTINDPFGKMLIGSIRVLALVRSGRVTEARTELDLIEKAIEAENKTNPAPSEGAAMPDPNVVRVGRAWVRIAEGDRAGGLKLLLEAAEDERKARANKEYANDPPMEPWPMFRLVGDAQFEAGDYRAAVEAYRQALEHEPGDAWSFAGLAKSWAKLGDLGKAREYAGQLLAVWSGADPGLRPMQEVQALELGAKPIARTPHRERKYNPADLNRLGPSNWAPFAAPKLAGRNPEGKPARLEDYRGKNVLLVFYLSDQCVHCVEQLAAINGKMAEFEANNTVVLAVSSDSPEKNRANDLSSFKLTLVSDNNHENARRYSSYDDFEDMELHSTILIDTEGRVRWKRTGGAPFMMIDYLLAEIKRWPGGSR